MRALTGLMLAGAAVAAAPSAAAAQADAPLCPWVRPVDNALADRLIPYLTTIRPVLTPGTTVTPRPVVGNGEAADAAAAVLGAQAVNVYLDHFRQGWSIWLAPGPLDATAARAGIRAYLEARIPAGEVEHLDRTLSVLALPFTEDELAAVRSALTPLLSGIATVGGGCEWSDGLRVHVAVADPETPELRARVDALVEPYGDKVRVRYGQGWPIPPHNGSTLVPAIVPPRPTLKVRDYVALPRTSRCVRGGAVSARPHADGVKRVRLAIGARVSAGAQPRIRLKSRRSKVTVTVTLADGATATETLSYRRC